MEEIIITIINMKKNKNDIKLLPGIIKEAESKKPKRTTYSKKHSANERFSHVKNIDDFLQDINLQEKFKKIMSYGYDLKRNHIYTHATEESNYETIVLLERLEIVSVEWDRFDNQTHREIGNRLITFSFYGNVALEILNRINGESSIITKRTLRIIAQHAKDMDLGDYFIKLLFSAGVPESLIDYSISLDDSGVAYRSLLYFSSSKKKTDHKILFSIIKKLSSSYVCGEDDKALEIQNKFGNLLRHDGYDFYDGKIKSLKKRMIGKPSSHKDTQKNIPTTEISLSIPTGKSFKDIAIKLLSDNKVEILIGDKIENYHGSEMGFLKTKHGKYIKKESFKFLIKLSANNGIYPLKKLNQDERDTITSRKKELKNLLMKIFRTRENPFYKYIGKSDEHKLKLKLIPFRELKTSDYKDRNMFDATDNHNPYADIKEVYEEDKIRS